MGCVSLCKETALISAVIGQYLDILNLLLEHGADVNQVVHTDNALPGIEVDHFNEKISKRLMEAGLDSKDSSNLIVMAVRAGKHSAKWFK